MAQIMSADELEGYRGKSVYFLSHSSIEHDEPVESGVKSSWRRIVSHSACIFAWSVGDILYTRGGMSDHLPGKSVCVELPESPTNAKQTKIVWLETYMSFKESNMLSGIFSTLDEANTRLSLIKLTSECYDGNMSPYGDLNPYYQISCGVMNVYGKAAMASFCRKVSLLGVA